MSRVSRGWVAGTRGCRGLVAGNRGLVAGTSIVPLLHGLLVTSSSGRRHLGPRLVAARSRSRGRLRCCSLASSRPLARPAAARSRSRRSLFTLVSLELSPESEWPRASRVFAAEVLGVFSLVFALSPSLSRSLISRSRGTNRRGQGSRGCVIARFGRSGNVAASPSRGLHGTSAEAPKSLRRPFGQCKRGLRSARRLPRSPVRGVSSRALSRSRDSGLAPHAPLVPAARSISVSLSAVGTLSRRARARPAELPRVRRGLLGAASRYLLARVRVVAGVSSGRVRV